MGFAGELTTIGLAEIFQNIAFNRLSGTLRLTSGERVAHIYFDSGVVAMLGIQGEPLDYFAIASGAQLADEPTLQTARKKSRRVGMRSALAKAGACDAADFDEAVAAHVEENLLLLFGWTTASFTFEEGNPAEGLFDREQRDSTIALDPQRLAMEAARRLDEWDSISRHI
ncbi:MAG: DUF4388 domain-containing protein, partial [Planctomycetota bacterium]